MTKNPWARIRVSSSCSVEVAIELLGGSRSKQTCEHKTRNKNKHFCVLAESFCPFSIFSSIFIQHFVFKYFSHDWNVTQKMSIFVKINYCKYKYVQYFIYIAKTLDIHTFTNSKRSQRPVKIASRAAYYQIKVNQDRRSGTSSFSYGSHKIKCFETF